MSLEKNSLRFSAAVMLAMIFGSYVFASSADASGTQHISRINSSIEVDANDRVGDISSVNGQIRVEREAVAGEISTVNGGVDITTGASIHGAESVNGGIRVGRNVSIRESLKTVNGDIRVRDGSVIGSEVKTVNGEIDLRATYVGEDVITSNGDITLSSGSEIEGDIIVRGNRGWLSRFFTFTRHRATDLHISADTVVHGDIHLYREVDLHIHDDAQIGEIVIHY